MTLDNFFESTLRHLVLIYAFKILSRSLPGCRENTRRRTGAYL